MDNLAKTIFGIVLWIFCNKIHPSCAYGYGNAHSALSGYKPLAELLEKMFENYEGRVRPFYQSSAVEVQLSTYIIDLLFVDEEHMEFTLDLYLRQYWVDPRLTFIPRPNIGHTIHLDPDYMSKMWAPDTYIANERKTAFHEGTVTQEWMRVKSDGEVRKSDRRTLTCSCPMTFYYYPFDRHVCSIEVESYSSLIHDLQFEWHGGYVSQAAIAINATNGTVVPFRVLHLEAKRGIAELPSGNFSRLSVEMTLQKYWGVFLAKYYIPLFLFVVVSLVTLWIRHFKFSCFLNFINLIFAHIFLLIPDKGGKVPYTEYWKAPNFYLTICLMYIYVSFLVSLANYICNKYELQYFEVLNSSKEAKSYMKIALELHPDEKLKSEKKLEQGDNNERSRRTSLRDTATQTYFVTAISKVLRICRITKWTLDISFVVVNIIFWLLLIFLSGSYRFPQYPILVDHDFK